MFVLSTKNWRSSSVRIKPRKNVGSAFSGISSNRPGSTVNWNTGRSAGSLTQLFSGERLGFSYRSFWGSVAWVTFCTTGLAVGWRLIPPLVRMVLRTLALREVAKVSLLKSSSLSELLNKQFQSMNQKIDGFHSKMHHLYQITDQPRSCW